jgi:hypothetical protein
MIDRAGLLHLHRLKRQIEDETKSSILQDVLTESAEEGVSGNLRGGIEGYCRHLVSSTFF